jgi:hypothetical protein
MDDKTKVKKEIDGSLVPPPRKVGILAVHDVGLSELALTFSEIPFLMM